MRREGSLRRGAAFVLLLALIVSMPLKAAARLETRVTVLFNQIAHYTAGRLDMPVLDMSAIGLLGLSNLAYLAAKQTAKPPVNPS